MRELGPIIELVVSWVITTALTFVIVLLDERYLLKGEKLERAWIPSSRDAAIVAFGVLALPIHFIKTRTSFRSALGILGFPFGLILGVTAVFIVAFIGSLVLEAVAWMLGLPSPS